MTEFISDTYGRRCIKEYRKYVKYVSEHEHELDHSLHREPSYIEFTLCATTPFLQYAPSWQPLRSSMEKCFLKHQIPNPLHSANATTSATHTTSSSSSPTTTHATSATSTTTSSMNKDKNTYEPCMHIIETIDQRGRNEMDSMLRSEPHQSSQISTAVSAYRRLLNQNERIHKQLNCVAYPEHSKCSTLRTNMFSDLSHGPCTEVFAASNQCFEHLSQKKRKAIWKHIFLSEDAAALHSYKNYCNQVQRDMVRCADKYFRLAVISYDMERTMELIDPEFRRRLIKHEWGVVTPAARKHAEEQTQQEKMEMERLYAKYKKQQEGQEEEGDQD